MPDTKPREQGDFLDPIVTRAIDKTIDRLTKGREHIVGERSKEVLGWVVHEAVVEVLTEVLNLEGKTDG